MAELEDKVEHLESELISIKADIHEVLVDLKELIFRDRNPLSGAIADSPVQLAT